MMLSIYLYRTNKFQPNVVGYAIVEGVLVFFFDFLSSDNIDKSAHGNYGIFW